MKIGGLQKLTLLDFPGRVACTVFTPGCNFRCDFCHNASLVFSRAGQITEDEVLSLLKKRIGMLDGVCITGGEPTLQRDLPDFMKKLKALGFEVKLDTNGTNPQMLEELISNGLVDYVAMDIKTSKEKYSLVTGIKELDVSPVERSVEMLKRGRVSYEFRTTAAKGLQTADDFEKISLWLENAENYFIQQYIPSDDMIGEKLSQFSKTELEEFRKIALKRVKNVALRGID